MLRIATIGTSMINRRLYPRSSMPTTKPRLWARFHAMPIAVPPFTAEHGGERNFTALDELASAADVDAVYIGSPNALHYEQALACHRRCKHVIVEKPFCPPRRRRWKSPPAEAAGVVALEPCRRSMTPLSTPSRTPWARLRHSSCLIGAFGKYSSRYNGFSRDAPPISSTAIWHRVPSWTLASTPSSPWSRFFGMPSGLTSMATLLDPTTRQLTHGPIDGCGSILASYGGGRISVELAHSKITNDLLPSQIEGERGTIQIDHLSTPRNVRIDYRGDVVRGSATEAPREQGDNGRVLDLPKSSNTMEYELTDFITAIGGIDNVKEEIWETPAGRHELGHYPRCHARLAAHHGCRASAGRHYLPAIQSSRHSDGLFDTFFSSVHRRQSRASKPSNIELELRRRLTVLASDEATQELPCATSCTGRGKSKALVFALPTPTSHRHAHSPAGCVTWKTAQSRWRYRELRQISYLISRRFMPPTSAWERAFAS